MARDIPTEAEVLGWYTSLSNWGRWIPSDTANDVAPSQYPGLGTNGAVHGVGMGALGLWLLDNPTFETLAAACAERGRSWRSSRRSSSSVGPGRR